MPTIEHSVLTTTELHEPKGIAAASADEVYVADGAASGSWQILNPYGGLIYNDLAGAGTVFTTPSAYTLCNVATTATNLNGFTQNSLGRLTYTGTSMRHAHAVFDSSFLHSSGAGNIVYFATYKNGSLLGDFEAAAAADSTTLTRMVLHFDTMMTTNDYFEVYTKTASGNVTVKHLYFFMMGMPG